MKNDYLQALELLKTIDPDELIYIAAPYTAKLADGSEDKDTIANRIREMSLCMEKLMRMGIKTCSPLLMHLLRLHVSQLPGDWQYWGDYSEVMLKRCNRMIVLMIDGWQESTGVNAEYDIAMNEKIPLIYLDPKFFLQPE
jgi:hypothetical protein